MPFAGYDLHTAQGHGIALAACQGMHNNRTARRRVLGLGLAGALAIWPTATSAAELDEALLHPTADTSFDLRVVVAPRDGDEIVGWVSATDATHGEPVANMELEIALAKGRYVSELEEHVWQTVTTASNGQADFRFEPLAMGGNFWVRVSTEHGGRQRSAASLVGFQADPKTERKRAVPGPSDLIAEALEAGLDRVPQDLSMLVEHTYQLGTLAEIPNLRVEIDGKPLAAEPFGVSESDDELIVTAQASARILVAGETLVLDVVARDRSGQPVGDAEVTVSLPYGSSQTVVRTDALGMARIERSKAELDSLLPAQGEQYRDWTLAVAVRAETGGDTGEALRGGTEVRLRTVHNPILLFARTDHALGTDGALTLYLGTSYADASHADAEVTITALDDPTPILRASTGRAGLVRLRVTSAQRRLLNAAGRLRIVAIDRDGQRGEAELGSLPIADDQQRVGLIPERLVLAPGAPMVLHVDAEPPGRAVRVAVLAGGHYIFRDEVKAPARLVVPYRPTMTGSVSVYAIATETPAGYKDKERARDEAIVIYRHGRDVRLRATSDRRRGSKRTIELAWNDRRPGVSDRDRTRRAALGIIAVERGYSTRHGGPNLIERILGPDYLLWRPDDPWLEKIAALDPHAPVPAGVEALVGVATAESQLFRFRVGSDRLVDDTWKKILPVLDAELGPVTSTLHKVTHKPPYPDPSDAHAVRSLLTDHGIDLERFRDPWNQPYHLELSFQGAARFIHLVSAGMDGQFGTPDDRAVQQTWWPYFSRAGQYVSAAVESAFQNQRTFLDSTEKLARWLAKDGFDWYEEKDPSGDAYTVVTSTSNGVFTLSVLGRTAPGANPVVVWEVSIPFAWRFAVDLADAYARSRPRDQPWTTASIEEALRAAGIDLEPWQDPHGKAIHFTVEQSDAGQAVVLWTPAGSPDTLPPRRKLISSIERKWVDQLFRERRRKPHFQKKQGAVYWSTVDVRGQKLAATRVEVRPVGSGDNAVRLALSDHHGNGRLLALDPGDYAFEVQLPGFQTVEYPRVRIREGRNTALEIIMSPPAETVCRFGSISPPYDTHVFDFPRTTAGTTSGKPGLALHRRLAAQTEGAHPHGDPCRRPIRVGALRARRNRSRPSRSGSPSASCREAEKYETLILRQAGAVQTRRPTEVVNEDHQPSPSEESCDRHDKGHCPADLGNPDARVARSGGGRHRHARSAGQGSRTGVRQDHGGSRSRRIRVVSFRRDRLPGGHHRPAWQAGCGRPLEALLHRGRGAFLVGARNGLGSRFRKPGA